ncbi:glycosyl transferase [Haladaptatus sp. W1]|uniref:glycosyltransferase n=1 Tax=Haladaptatus sp. W1 TaxID=1897478 RepID=UPI000849801D|nr:glycosyltransferase [Haladaptatus sp. W1]ODR80540.1 glycosyl transferase [Haladaptatus sp. W1]
MEEHPPISILLPTTRWNSVCEELSAQLRDKDELLIICDSKSDPIAGQISSLPEQVEILFAGSPKSCSGKANAIATGMEEASHQRLVWTDDDFHHPPDWLSQLHRDYEQNGPVTEIPFFIGKDPLAMLLEPVYAFGGTLGVYIGDIVWGGAVMFDRIEIDEQAFLDDLQRTISDDGVLTEYLDVTPLRRVRTVPIGGSFRQTLERHTRFSQIVHYQDPTAFAVLCLTAVITLIGCLLFPVPALILLTLLYTAIYLFFGVKRWTAILAYPSVLIQLPLLLYGISRTSFVWAGRRYEWRSKFDVDVYEE